MDVSGSRIRYLYTSPYFPLTLLASQFKDGRPAASANATPVTTLSLPRPAHPTAPAALTISRMRCRAKGRGATAGGEKDVHKKLAKIFKDFFPVKSGWNKKHAAFFWKGGGNVAAIKPVPNTVRVKLVPCWVFCGCDSAREWFFSTSETNRTSLGCSWGSCSLSNFNFSFWLQVTNKFDKWIQSLDHKKNLNIFSWGRWSPHGKTKIIQFRWHLLPICHPQGVWHACAILNRWWMDWPGRSCLTFWEDSPP